MTTKKLSDLISELDKVQKYYIEGHKTRNLTVLAKDIGARVPCVRAYLKYLENLDRRKEIKAKKDAEKAQPVTVPITSHVKADDLMIKKRSVVIMTPESSQLGDTAKKRPSVGPNLAKNIQKIRPN